jgi:hypothetical protein
MNRKVILFELNEVPERVLNSYCLARPDSALAKLRSRSSYHPTFTEDQGHLSPWITWPTLHRGVANDRHGIAHLGQPHSDVDRVYPAVWQLLADQGATVGVCGSLHSYPVPPAREYAFFLPDTFAPDSAAHPAELEAFQAFNLAMAGKSARNVDTTIDFKSAARLLPHLPSLKFTLQTAGAIASQLVQERVTKSRKVRRRTMQAVLSFDPFMAKLAETKPDFCTFFTNHVASAMHRFWGAMFPDDFDDLEYGNDWIKDFSSEIEWSMNVASQFIGRLVTFVDRNPEYVLIVTSSMGQSAASGAAYDSELAVSDVAKFMKRLGVPREAYEQFPAMMPDYSFVVNESHREAFVSTLRSMTLGREHKPIGVEARDGGFTHVTIGGMQNFDPALDNVFINNQSFSLSEFGFAIVENDFRQGCTGYHIPDGILLAYDPREAVGKAGDQVSTCDIVPSILDVMGVSRPSYMNKAQLLS